MVDFEGTLSTRTLHAARPRPLTHHALAAWNAASISGVWPRLLPHTPFDVPRACAEFLNILGLCASIKYEEIKEMTST